ncbi:MAG: hypothetical protein ACP5NQ_00850 [Vulcanisaeta sp.]
MRNSRNLLINYNDILKARYIRKRRGIDINSLAGGIMMLMFLLFPYYIATQLQITFSGGLFFASISLLIYKLPGKYKGIEHEKVKSISVYVPPKILIKWSLI